jgi:hypothetical protein
VRQVKVQLGWFPLRIPEWPRPLWALVAHQPEEERDLVLLTQVPITTAEARLVSDQWRHRPSIEHTYRFRAAKSAWMSKICAAVRRRHAMALCARAAHFLLLLTIVDPGNHGFLVQ